MTTMGRLQRIAALAMLTGAALLPDVAWSQHMYKCGASYQDRPCADKDVQQRYSGGRFDIDQVNPDTDKDCARLVGELMPYWQRMYKGESVDRLRAEYDAKPVGRADKSAMRDLLLSLKEIGGPPPKAQGQLETQCMNYKRRKGLVTEAEAARVSAGSAAPSSRQLAAQRRAEAAAERARRAEQRSSSP